MRGDDSFDKKVEKTLGELFDHGLLLKQDVSIARYVEKYKEKFGMDYWRHASGYTDCRDPTEVLQKMNKKQTKLSLYYFHTDLKFILKARLWQLDHKFVEATSVQNKVDMYRCSNKESNDARCKEMEVRVEDANAQRFKCLYCPKDLEKIEYEEELNQEDISKCTE
jgi:hypothetical protein